MFDLPISLWSLISTSLVGIFTWWCWYQWSNRKKLAFARKLPTVLPTLPFLGHLPYMLPYIFDPSEFIIDMLFDKMNKAAISQNVKNFCVWIGPVPMVMIQAPEDLQIVLNSSKSLDRGPEYALVDFVLDDSSLLYAKKKVWKHIRRSMDPVFHHRNLELVLPTVNSNGRKLAKHISHHYLKSGDILEEIKPNVLDNVQGLIMGRYLNTKDNPDAITRILNLVLRSFMLWGKRFAKYYIVVDLSAIFQVVHSKELRTIQRDSRLLTNVAVQQLLSKQAVDPSSGVVGPDPVTLSSIGPTCMVDIYLSPPKKYESHLTARGLHNNTCAMAAAAVLSSSTTLASCFLLLAMHPQVQEKVYEEVVSVMGDSDRDLTPEDATRFVYLGWVLKETLRLYPPFPLISRSVTEDLKLSSMTVPAGTDVSISIFGNHRNPHYFPDPDSFIPERFSMENSMSVDRPKYAYLPFSAGPRNCIGKAFSMMTMKVTVAHVVKCLRLKTNARMEDIKLFFSMEMFFKNGYPILVESR